MINQSLSDLAQQVGDALKKHKLMLATAESCTGGGLSYWITSISGSSDWFDRGFVTYSNPAKLQMLGVTAPTLTRSGAVSSEVAKEMAEGALDHSDADVSIAVTGIAGPLGGTADKPVGTVWIAWAKRNTPTLAKQFVFQGDRHEVREQTVNKSLAGLLDYLHSR